MVYNETEAGVKHSVASKCLFQLSDFVIKEKAIHFLSGASPKEITIG